MPSAALRPLLGEGEGQHGLAPLSELPALLWDCSRWLGKQELGGVSAANADSSGGKGASVGALTSTPPLPTCLMEHPPWRPVSKQ